jgi:hypothetical protein
MVEYSMIGPKLDCLEPSGIRMLHEERPNTKFEHTKL